MIVLKILRSSSEVVGNSRKVVEIFSDSRTECSVISEEIGTTRKFFGNHRTGINSEIKNSE